jgi:LEA14-like dessication related protein
MGSVVRRRLLLLALCAAPILTGCATLPHQDPLSIAVAGVEPLPGEGLELRLAIRVRIQNPNDAPIEYTGAALTLEMNGRRLASGVSAAIGTVPRYGETVLTIPVTVSAFDMARQVLGFANAPDERDVRYRVRGKLEAGWLGTRRFTSDGVFELPAARRATREGNQGN